MIKKMTLILLILTQVLLARWGWGSHRFINDAAVDHLPPEMVFFQDHRDFLSDHSTDPDIDNLPGYYHYIDIDDYPEFFSGQLPNEWQTMVDTYGQSRMEDNGIVPWVIEWWMEDLQALMEAGDWTNVWQVAAELGHYVADSHQALHLTVNYNGGSTGNYGIHSRYETDMVNPHLDTIVFPDSIAAYWTSPIDSIFSYIEDIYPIVDLVMQADDAASAVDNDYGSTYYSLMWEALGDTTIWTLNRSTLDVASIWYTVWVNAGSPYPSGVGVDEKLVQPEKFRISAYPNPFNAQTSLKLFVTAAEQLTLKILDLQGRLVVNLAQDHFQAGEYSLTWDGKDQNGLSVDSGVYLFQVSGAITSDVYKLSVIK